MTLGRLRWAVVVGAVVLIAGVELVSDTILDAQLRFPADLIAVVTVVLVAAFLLSRAAFREIDRLTDAVRERGREVEARAATARTLDRLSIAGAHPSAEDEVLRIAVDGARELLGADVALLVLLEADGQPHLRAMSGPDDAFRVEGDLGGGDYARFVDHAWLRGHLDAPLLRGDRQVGTLAVGVREDRRFDLDAVATLASLANHTALALENARLQAQVRELAVRGERERIAREMHDGLAQVLAYVGAKSQAAGEFIAAGKLPEAQAHLAELSEAARSVYVDVREAILGLSSPVERDRGLVASLEDYAHRFAEASKLAVRVETAPGFTDVSLTPQVEAQVFRIVQEALTNARKHAAARRVVVALAAADGRLTVEVRDDGRGLPDEADGSAWPRYGLQAMRERAASINATLALDGRPNAGTTVRLAVPLGPER